MKIHQISPQPLTFEIIESILEDHIQLSLSDESRKRIVDCKAFLDQKLAQHEGPIYGINTGFGALHDKSISKSDLNRLQENLVMSHACGVGREVPKEVVRLMLLLKIHALSLGKSGVQLQTVERLIALFNHNILPIVLDAARIDWLFSQANGPRALEIEVDLLGQTLTPVGGKAFPFDMDPFHKECLHKGLDDIGLTLNHVDGIRAYEERRRREAPWLFA